MNRDEAIYAAALELPTVERAAYLKQACAGNELLRLQVEALLAANDEADEYFDSTAVARPPVPVQEKPGDRIGRYKLLQMIGEGGCGVVYMAEQEEPVRRRVALKVIKLGMDTKAVIARFEAERQALALMDHPNIARVLDAGATETGRPFFVMELVRGIPITRYCDEENLPAPERLQLFIQVCHAIQHAHTKGIVHRDIKPSNILVTMHDDTPTPKVIDFGIAKATQGRLTDQTLFTAFEQFIGTPAYMSPEQAQFNDTDVDTRSDIYSLGVLLYELLTGRPPFDPKTLQQQGIDEIRRIIREVEPPRPSMCLNTLSDADRVAIAKSRRMAPAQLTTLVRGDLDWIAMKAIEKKRARRYESASALAADVKRHLSHEPVAARPPSTVYRLQKFSVRHRFSLGAAAAVIVALGAGLALSHVTRNYADQNEPAVIAHAPLGAPPPKAGMITRQVWARQAGSSGPDVDSDGTISPDGRFLSYTDWATGDLALHDVLTGKDRRLTNKGTWSDSKEFANGSAISPNGKQVAYGWAVSNPGRSQKYFWEVRIIDLDTGKPRTLFASRSATNMDPEWVWVSDWSPDGQSVVVRLHTKNTVEIGLVSIVNGALRSLISTDRSRGVGKGAISPDGKFLAYDTKTDSDQREIRMIVVEGSRETYPFPTPVNGQVLGWLPDGRHMLFASDRSGLSGIWALPVAEGKPQGEPQLIKSNVLPVALGITRSGAFHYAVATSGSDIYLATADFEAGKVLSSPRMLPKPFVGLNDFPQWSPDGKFLAYVSRKDANPRNTLPTSLMIRSMESGKVRELSHDLVNLYAGGSKGRPVFGPDGSYLVVAGTDRNGRQGIYRIDAENSHTTPLVIRAAEEGPLSVRAISPDEKTLYVKKSDSNTKEQILVAVEIASGGERELGRRSSFGDAVLSPDGRLLATTGFVTKSKSASLLLIPVDGGELRELLRVSVTESLGAFVAWTPDGKSVLFRKFPIGKERPEPWRISIEGGAARKIDLQGALGRNPSIHPDGHQIAFVGGSNLELEIWAIENITVPAARTAIVTEPKPDTASATVVRTLADSGFLSPDETKISDDRRNGTLADITIKDLQSGAIATVTNPRADRNSERESAAWNHVWSPDSNWIAYTWNIDRKDEPSTSELRIASSAGNRVKRVKFAQAEERIVPVDWSPDGRQLLCFIGKKDGPAALGWVNVETGDFRELTSSALRHPRVSPDGKFIAYEKTQDGNRDIHLLSTRNGQELRLTQAASEEGSPVWSVDGKYVLYSSNRSGRWDLLAIEINDGKPAGQPFIVKSDFPERDKRITTSGKLLFSGITPGLRDVYLISVDSATGETRSEPKLLTRSHYGQHTWPTWSADGRKIAYIRGPAPGRPTKFVCVQSLSDGREEVFETGIPYIVHAYLAPDASSVAVWGNSKENKWGVYKFNFSQSRLDPVVPGGNEKPRGFSRDGREFRMEKYAVDLATKKVRNLEIAQGLDNGDYDVSPDGTTIVYVQVNPSTKERTLVQSDVQFRSKQVIGTVGDNWPSNYPRWSPDGRSFIYLRYRGEQPTELRVRAADGSWDKQIETGKLNVPNWLPAAWSPDSSTLAVTLSESGSKAESGTLENFLPREKLTGR